MGHVNQIFMPFDPVLGMEPKDTLNAAQIELSTVLFPIVGNVKHLRSQTFAGVDG